MPVTYVRASVVTIMIIDFSCQKMIKTLVFIRFPDIPPFKEKGKYDIPLRFPDIPQDSPIFPKIPQDSPFPHSPFPDSPFPLLKIAVKFRPIEHFWRQHHGLNVILIANTQTLPFSYFNTNVINHIILLLTHKLTKCMII